jgi:hypothetical protein
VVFSGYAGFPINKTDCHNITEILLKVALNAKTKPNQKKNTIYFYLTKTYFSKSIPQVTDKLLSHNVVLSIPQLSGV